jgi:hypothetical protein
MMSAPGRNGAGGSSVLDDVIVWALAAAGALGATVWAGAQLAVLVAHQRSLPVGLSSAVQAAVRLPSSADDPAAAWPAEVHELLPGPVLYWLCTVAAGVALLGAVAAGYRAK